MQDSYYRNTVATSTSSPAFSPYLLVRAFEISDYLKAANLPYPDIESEAIVTSIVDERFRPAVVRRPTRRTTQRAQSSDPPPYPTEWAVDRSQLTASIRTFVAEYHTWKADVESSRQGTVTPPKPHSTGNTPINTPSAPHRRSYEDLDYPEDEPISKLILPSIEKPSEDGNPRNPSHPTSSTSRNSGKPTSTPPSTTMPDSWQNTGFSEQQWSALQALIGGIRSTPGPAGPAGPPGPTGVTEGSGPNRWNAAEIGFFDPHYDGKTAATASAVEHTGKDTYFRDVHVFIERCRDMAAIKTPEMVRNNLYTCLRGVALEWYTSTLSREQKFYVKHGNDIDHWTEALIMKWKESPSTALATITRERYTMDDARRHREPIEYAQIITRAARSAGMSVYNQIYLMYNGLDLEFRRDLDLPTEATDMNSFMNQMEAKREIWWALGARNRGGNPTAYGASSGNQRGFNNRSGNNAPRQYGQGQYQDGYRSNSGPMGAGNGAMEARPAYGSQPPLRNQFPTSYQFRSLGPSFQFSYQNRAYQTPQY